MYYGNSNYYHDYLIHHGVKGMKWGVRKAQYGARAVRGHAGPGRYLTRKRQLAGDKRDLERLNNGEHLSVGLTKKRQDAYDARDRRALEKRITKNEKHFAQKAEKKAAKNTPEAEAARKEMTKKVAKGAAFVAASAITAYAVNKAVKKKYADLVADEVVNSVRISSTQSFRNSEQGRAQISKWVETGRTNAKNRSFSTAAKGVANYYTDRAGYRIGGTIGHDIVNRTTRFNVSAVPYHYLEKTK